MVNDGAQLEESSRDPEDASLSAMFAAIQENWLGSFILNLVGYAIIILPAALAIRKLKQSPLVKKGKVVRPLFYFRAE